MNLTDSAFAIKLSSFFDAASDIFILYDEDLCISSLNLAGVRFFSLSKESLIGKHITEVFPSRITLEKYEKYCQVIRTGEPVTNYDVITDKQGNNLYLCSKAFKMDDGLGLIITNITELKKNTKELTQFSYKLSHDIRSPLLNIIGLSNIAQQDTNDEVTLNYLELINQQAKRLDELLSTIINPQQAKEKNINFNTLINEILESLSYLEGYNDLNIIIDIRSEQSYCADELLMTSIFQNFIDNAIKYRKKDISNSFLRIAVTDEDGCIKIIVQDNGIGIPQHLQKDIFDMFVRATDQASGTGIGLHTIKSNISKLNGHITMDSEENVGTTFTIYLPMNRK